MSIDLNLLTYNALDCCCTDEVWRAIKDDIDANDYRWAYNFTMRMYEPLMFMQTRGLKVDFANMEQTKIDITAKREEYQAELNKLCGRELNANSPQQVAAYFYVEKGIPAYYNKEGGVTTDDKALQRIARGTAKRSGLREARLIQDIRGLVKLYSTYLDIEFDADGRLRCAYNPRGTKFGRLSSSETVFRTGTNLQNLPQEFKKFLVPDAGYFFWEVDKRQAEWVVVAYLANDANMISVLENNEDAHIHTAHLMYKVDKEILKAEAKLLGSLSDADEIAERRQMAGIYAELPRTMSARQMGKKSNHGLNYDEGFNTFALLNEIETREAKRAIDLYHSIYPGIRKWHEWTRAKLSKERYLTTCFGRRIHFLDAWGDDLFKAAYSALPQATVADNTNLGLRLIYEDDELCSTAGYNIDVLAQTHDSVLMQVPFAALDNGFDGVIERVYNYMEPELEYNGRKFTIKTDSKMGMNWASHHGTHNPDGMKELSTADEVKEFLREQSRIA